MRRKDTEWFWYYKNYLTNILMNMYEWKGLPEGIDSNYLEWNLQRYGYGVMTEYEKELVFVTGALTGLRYDGKPNGFTSANPILKTFTRKIDKDCVVCYNTWDYYKPQGFNRIVNVFARKLEQLEIALQTSLINSRQSIVFRVSSDAEAERARQFYSHLSDGDPALFQYKGNNWQSDEQLPMITLSAKDQLIVPEIQDAYNNIMQDFLRSVGVRGCTATDKKAQINDFEASSDNQILTITESIYLTPRKQFCEKANKMFGTNISVDIRGKISEEEVKPDVIERQEGDNQ